MDIHRDAAPPAEDEADTVRAPLVAACHVALTIVASAKSGSAIQLGRQNVSPLRQVLKEEDGRDEGDQDQGESGNDGKQKEVKQEEDEQKVHTSKGLWNTLVAALLALKGDLNVSRGRAEEKCVVCYNVFRLILDERLRPLMDDSAYVGSLDKSEADSVPVVEAQWPTPMTPTSMKGSDETTRAVLLHAVDTTPIVLLRVFHHSVYKTTEGDLDLGCLNVPEEALYGLRISAICSAFGLDTSAMKGLNLSLNEMRYLPSWVVQSFPSLARLSLAGCHPIPHLPLSVICLPVKDIDVRQSLIDNADSPKIFPARHPRGPMSISASSGDPPLASTIERPSEFPTLAHTIAKLCHDRSSPPPGLNSLPDHLKHLVTGTYVCELCREYIYPGQDVWVGEQVERTLVLGVSVLMMRTCGTHEYRIRQAMEARGEVYKPPKTEELAADQMFKVAGRACGRCIRKYAKPTEDTIGRLYGYSRQSQSRGSGHAPA